MELSTPLLSVQNLEIVFETIHAKIHALNNVNLSVGPGEVLGIVGESGSGKSSLALAIMRLLPTPTAKVLGDSKIIFGGRDILECSERQMEDVRGRGISMIFQEPLTSLNPVFTIGEQLGEAVRIGLEKEKKNGQGPTKHEIRDLSIEWLRKVGLADPERAVHRYPHELSGGMRQRVIIGIALATKPSLILADEPTSALDVTTQSQILELLKSLIKETKVSVLFISHDLAVVAQIADRVIVMYAGMVIESAKAIEIFDKPLHPYTEALISCLPKDAGPQERLEVITGTVPDISGTISGCPFSPRCKYVMKSCDTMPAFKEVSPDRQVACWLR